MQIHSVPSLQDNYIYIIADNNHNAVVVDPGEAAAVLSFLTKGQLQPAAVLLTHRHADHIGGLPALLEAYPHTPVYAPAGCGSSGALICRGGDTVRLLNEALSLSVIATPGHTLEHIAYFCQDGGSSSGSDSDGSQPFLLSGDTLFIGGCGRVFEGSMQQMHDSLAALAALPDDTRIYCGHEYTLTNLRFAAAVEPENEAVRARLAEVEDRREAQQPTVPGLLAQERETNPFLRLTQPAVIAAAEAHSGQSLADSVAVFAALRGWKDTF